MTGAAAPARSRPRWLVSRPGPPGAVADLYCFPHAGGSPGEYARWGDDLPDVRLRALQLPGRGARLAEPPYTRMAPLVAAISEQVPFRRPLVLFGHSLGGLVAFEVARALRERGLEPGQVFLSSCPPPPVPHDGEKVYTLPDAGLLAEVQRRWGPLPAEVTASPRLASVAAACFRADLEVYETYEFEPGEPLTCPVTVLAGTGERAALAMDGWRAHTTGPLREHYLPGGHFYHRQQRQRLLATIHHALTTDPATTVTAERK